MQNNNKIINNRIFKKIKIIEKVVFWVNSQINPKRIVIDVVVYHIN